MIKLRNGATVLRADLVQHGMTGRTEGTVLALTADGEWVTWAVQEDSDGTYVAYWGHYFNQSRDRALADFAQRAARVVGVDDDDVDTAPKDGCTNSIAERWWKTC